jgi:quercetin dioxygenase-like cupin family protein
MHDHHGKGADAMDGEALPSLIGWDIHHGSEVEWIPWGGGDNARAKVLGEADGYVVALVEAQAGYRGSPHEHAHAEFFYVLEGTLTNQGETVHAGDGYAAAAGSTHTRFEARTAARYLSIFRL